MAGEGCRLMKHITNLMRLSYETEQPSARKQSLELSAGSYLMNLRCHAKAAMRISIATALSLLAFNTLAQQSAESNTDQDETAEIAIEEVVVYGIRQSLESALDEKRAKKNLIEVINAEDIGKLPDENLAEVLENIPGVQISRNAGIGSSVSIRGSEDNRVEINGRGTTPSGDSRGGMSFEDLPAALVRSLNVVKVPTADMVEGSIGGTIDVKTYRGLRLKDRLTVFRAATEYAENADSWNQSFSATLGDKFATENGDVGAILTFSHMEKTVREDSLRVSPGIRDASQSNMDFNGDGISDAYYKPGFADLLFGTEDRDSTAVSGSIEWQYSSDLKLFAEASYTDFSRLNLGQSMFIGAAGSDQELDGAAEATYGSVSVGGVTIPMLTSGVIGGGILNAGADQLSDTGTPNDGMRLRSNNRAGSRDTESYLAAIGGEWDSDNVKVEFEVSAAGSDTQEASFTTVFQFNDPTATNFHSAGAAIRVPFYYDYRDGVLEYGPTGDRVTTTQLLDPNYYSLFIARDQDSFFDNEETAATVDVTWFRNSGMWQEIKAGIRISDRSINRSRLSQVSRNFPGFSGSDLAQFLAPTPGDFFEFRSNGAYLDNFLTGNTNAIFGQRRQLRSLIGLDTDGVTDPLQGFGVDENTYAGYLRGDFELDILGLPAQGIAGFRVVNTDQNAAGNEVMIDGSLRDVSESQDYTEVLPSLSLVISPMDDVQIRFGAAKIMRRPSFGDLSPTVRYPLNTGQAVLVGDPTLQPTTAKQFDLTLEYYPRKGSVMSLGIYHKDLDGVVGRETIFSGICNPRAVDANAGNPDLALPVCTVAGEAGVLVNRISPVNLPGGKIDGIEVAFQHYFRNLPQPFNGLGIIANYAYQNGSRDQTFTSPAGLNSNGDRQDLPLNFVRLSENSYNFTAFYEKPRWSARLRYTYRDVFLVSESTDISNGFPLYSDDRGQLNASLSLNINEKTALTVSGVNLLKDRTVQPGVFANGPIARMMDSDRRVTMGIRIKL